jgi:FdhD protein
MLARERAFRVVIDGEEFLVRCSPENLDELALGLAYVERLNPNYRVESFDLDLNVRVSSNVVWSVEEIKKHLHLIDLHDVTKAHHIAVVVGKDGMIARAIDVSRHNAMLKVVGMCVKKGIDFSKVFLLLSSRVTFDIAYRCVKAGIPLLVTKKAVTDLVVKLCEITGLSLISFGSGLTFGDAIG